MKNCRGEMWSKATNTDPLPATTEVIVKTVKYPASLTNGGGHQVCTHQLQQLRCSSTGSSICDTLSSHSESALSPTESTTLSSSGQLPSLPAHHHLHHQHHPVFSLCSPSTPTTTASMVAFLPSPQVKSDNREKNITNSVGVVVEPPSVPVEVATRLSQVNQMPPTTSITANTMPTVPVGSVVVSPPSNQTDASTPVNTAAALIGDLGAAAMAVNLAESFTLLHQQAHHFRDFLYAAQLLGRGNPTEES